MPPKNDNEDETYHSNVKYDIELNNAEKGHNLATEILYRTHHRLYGCSNRDRRSNKVLSPTVNLDER